MKHQLKLALGLFLGLLLGAAPPAHSTPTVGSDGAVSVNISWEQGKSSLWYIELQREGPTEIVTGIENEDDAMIRHGILITNWGFAHQRADGSFGTTGDAFHSTAIFVEATAYATLKLKNYHPATYKANTSYYASKVSTYTTDLRAAGLWLTQPSVSGPGQVFDSPYTHRRYMLAAALGQIGLLSGDTTLSAAAVPYIQDGLSLQMTSGSQSVVYPDGVHTVTLVGVNPELGGYDVSYLCTGIVYAQHYYAVCTDSALKASLLKMMNAAMYWESHRINSSGSLDVTGSTRIGVEPNRDGTIKEPNSQDIISALSNTTLLGGRNLCIVSSYRYTDIGRPVTSDVVAADGSVNGNTAWENGTATTWSVAQQRIGGDYAEAGFLHENDGYMRKGILVLNWGFAHQLADGSFGTTNTPYYAAAQFLEGAARAAQILSTYHPSTYGADLAYFSSTATTYIQKCDLTANWLTSSANWATVQRNAGTSSVRWYALAAALAATAQVANDPRLYSYANQAALSAVALQKSSGEDPENGAADVNNQALGLYYSGRYIGTSPAGSVDPSVGSALLKGLVWETQYIHVDGTVTGTGSPATKSMDDALRLGYGLLGDQRLWVARARLNRPDMQLFL